MKNKIIFLALISISLLIFSCETDTKLGYNILPKDDILDFQIIDTSSVEVYTYLEDSIATDKVSSLLLGEYNDPIFGYSKASFVSEYGIVEYPSFTADYTIDSAILYLVPDTINLNHYGNLSNSQEIKVYEIKNSLNDTITYFNNFNPEDLDGELLGVKEYSPSASDTLVAIRLQDGFALSFKTLASDVSNDSFKDFFKGIYVTSETSGHDGAILKFKLNSESTIKVYSHLENGDEYIFSISANLNSDIRFNLFTHDYSTTSFYNNIGNETIAQDTVAYIQAMGGLKTKIKFPFINELKKLDKIAINRAELIVPTANENITEEATFPVIENMVLTGISDDGKYYLLPEYISNNSYKTVSYTNSSYKFDIAGYIRDILDGNAENNGLFLFSGSGSTSMKRSVITTGNNSNRMKLVISYTNL